MGIPQDITQDVLTSILSPVVFTAADEPGQVGQAIEFDSAFGITPQLAGQQLLMVGQALETDTGSSVSPGRSLGLGQAIENAVAQAMVVSKVRLVGSALETDTAQVIEANKSGGFLTPSIDQAGKIAASGSAHVHTITAPPAGDHIILVGVTTDGSHFDPPTDNSAGANVWNQVYSRNIASWGAGFNLGIIVYIKESDGDETQVTLTPGANTSASDSTGSFIRVVSGLAAGNPFDVSGENDVAPGVGSTLTMSLGAATAQAVSFVMAVAAFRDDDTGSFTFSNIDDTNDDSLVRNTPNFDITGFFAAEVKTVSAAHSTVFNQTGGGNDELMGAILAFNARAA